MHVAKKRRIMYTLEVDWKHRSDVEQIMSKFW